LASNQRERNEIFCVIKEILRKINIVRTELRAKETGMLKELHYHKFD
jgi:hypothetical protein